MRVLAVLLTVFLIILVTNIPASRLFQVDDKAEIVSYQKEEHVMSSSYSNSSLSNTEPEVIQDTFSETSHHNNIIASDFDLVEVDLSLHAETDFVSTWQTNLRSDGSSINEQISLPLEPLGTYNFTVEWGDGSSDTITSWNQPEKTHTYSTVGQYVVTISGMLNGWTFNGSGDRRKIVEIHQWGNLGLGNSGSYFAGAENLVLSATDAPNLKGTTTLEHAFSGAKELGLWGNMDLWDVSNVTNMESMFHGATNFNQSLYSWNVSQVTNMKSMFQFAFEFNQPLSNWNVSKVTNMESMFYGAVEFNQPLIDWDVSKVTNMASMFLSASRFNQPLNSWNVSQVTILSSMFFHASSFNQTLRDWDVSSVKHVGSLFAYASSFDQPLGSWNVSLIRSMSTMFSNISLSTSNYDSILLGWSKLDVQYGVVFNAGNSDYSDEAQSARDILTETHGWTIYDKRNQPEGYERPQLDSRPPIGSIFLTVVGLSIVLIFISNIRRRIGQYCNRN